MKRAICLLAAGWGLSLAGCVVVSSSNKKQDTPTQPQASTPKAKADVQWPQGEAPLTPERLGDPKLAAAPDPVRPFGWPDGTPGAAPSRFDGMDDAQLSDYARATLIPKREMGVDAFQAKYPEYDGRGVIIAVFDTGVDPGAEGLTVTSTGLTKVIDIIDGSGSGDVDMTTTATLSTEGTLVGKTGRTLTMPADVTNPGGVFRVGWKQYREVLGGGPRGRVDRERREFRERTIKAEREERQRIDDELIASGKKPADSVPDSDLKPAQLEVRIREQLLEKLEDEWIGDDTGRVFDCVLWNDGTHWRVLVDTDEDGDMADEVVLRPYGVAHEFTNFGDTAAVNFGVQVYEGGDLLSIVATGGSHGTHVASIASACFPDQPERNGMAPGAQILSIRMGDARVGGSNLTGEMRATAASAQYGVDVMNASWGGGSLMQDGQDLSCRLYERLVREHNVTAFVSAGNNGTALSVLGSPGGDCQAVIGVGAYVSKDMSQLLHQVNAETGDTAYQFSARGPSRGGDLGVDIIGPGGATASLAFESVGSSALMNGTSMSSPAVAGVGALLISAAKANGFHPTPERVRHALMNTAHFVPDVEVFAQGAGLAQVGPAWDHLRKYRDVAAFDVGFKANVNANELNDGPGYYTRLPHPAGRKEFLATIDPVFQTPVPNAERYTFGEDIVLETTAPWVRVPRYWRLANGDTGLRPVMDVPAHDTSASADPLYAEIRGHLASHPEAGPLFRIPITIMQPQVLEYRNGWRTDFDVALGSGDIARRAFVAPEGCNWMRLRLSRPAAEDNTRMFSFQAVTLQSDEGYSSKEFDQYKRLDAGEVAEYLVPTMPGRTVELSMNHMWSSALGTTVLHGDVEFFGVESPSSEIVLAENQTFGTLEARARWKDVAANVTAVLKDARYNLVPTKVEYVSLDERDVFPSWKEGQPDATYWALLQTYEWESDEKASVRLGSYDAMDRMSEELANGLVQAFAENGELLWQGSSYGGPTIKLPKGKTTFYRLYRTIDRSILEQVKTVPLVLRRELDSEIKLPIYGDYAAAARGNSGSNFTLRNGRDAAFIIGDGAVGKLKAPKPEPMHYTGEVKIASGSDTLLTVPLYYRLGSEYEDPKDDPKKKDAKRDPIEALNEKLLDERLAFLDKHQSKTDRETVTSHTLVLEQVKAIAPDDARVLLAEAHAQAIRAKLVGEALGGPKDDDKPSTDSVEATMAPDAIVAQLDRAVAASEPEAVAAFFGARPEPAPGDEKAERELSTEEKKRNRQRDVLRDAALLKTDIALHRDDVAGARAAFQESLRWQDKPSKETNRLEVALLDAEGYPARALEVFRDEVAKESGREKRTRKELVKRLRGLGLDRYADLEEFRLKLDETRTQPSI